jgi:hypothetical protein
MKLKEYPQWNSQFYDSVFANPAPDPLKDLKEVSFKRWFPLAGFFFSWFPFITVNWF